MERQRKSSNVKYACKVCVCVCARAHACVHSCRLTFETKPLCAKSSFQPLYEGAHQADQRIVVILSPPKGTIRFPFIPSAKTGGTRNSLTTLGDEKSSPRRSSSKKEQIHITPLLDPFNTFRRSTWHPCLQASVPPLRHF